MTGARLSARVVAALAVTSAGLHLAALPAVSPLGVLLLMAMLLACFSCLPALWRGDDPSACLTAGWLAVAMVAVHLTGLIHLGGHQHHATDHPTAMSVATVIAAVESVVALGTAALVRRNWDLAIRSS